MTEKLYATDLKEACRTWLTNEGYTKIIDERSFPAWARTSSGCIFDMIAAKLPETKSKGDPIMIGIEIKSDRDSLKRLDNQIIQYLDAFDYVYILLQDSKAPFHPLVGILRYNLQLKKVVVEKKSMWLAKSKYYDILTTSEIRALCYSHGISKKSGKLITEAFEILPSIRKKLVYNRFFAKMNWSEQLITEHIKFSETELTLLLRLGVTLNFTQLKNQAKILKKISESVVDLSNIAEKIDLKDETQFQEGIPFCSFCKSTQTKKDEDLTKFKGQLLCKSCVNLIKKFNE